MPLGGTLGPFNPTAASGWPQESEVVAKLAIIAPDGLTDGITGDLEGLLAAVIAEFQSPVGPDGGGGTGRRFDPVTETRLYDGNGFPELRVEDIVPGTSLTVTSFGVVVSNVFLKTEREGLGYNILARQQGALGLSIPYTYASVWPRGAQNIAVTATWGYAAVVPQDVWEAIRCEVTFRALVQGSVQLAGAGEIVKIGEFEVNTAAGVSVWKDSSPLAILHRTYLECRDRYRDRGGLKLARMKRRMS
jgi:hypothetical protein